MIHRLTPNDLYKLLNLLQKGDKNHMPPFVYTLAFWQALAYLIAALVAYFTSYKLEAGVLLAVILAVLKMFQIQPQVRVRLLGQMLSRKSDAHHPPE